MTLVCGRIPVAISIPFDVGSVIRRGINDSNNFGFRKTRILEYGGVVLDGIIVRYSHEWKIKYATHRLRIPFKNVFT